MFYCDFTLFDISIHMLCFLCVLFLSNLTVSVISEAYHGKYIGELSRRQHGVRGKVHIASNKRIYLTELYYDGNGPGKLILS